MIEQLLSITDKLIEINKDNENEYKKYLLIKKILTTKNSFLNMDVEYAYSILRDLQIPEDNLKSVYMQLI